MRGAPESNARNLSKERPLSRTLVPSVNGEAPIGNQVNTSKRMIAKMAGLHPAIKDKCTPSDGGFTGKKRVFLPPLNEKSTLVRCLLIQYLCLI